MAIMIKKAISFFDWQLLKHDESIFPACNYSIWVVSTHVSCLKQSNLHVLVMFTYQGTIPWKILEMVALVSTFYVTAYFLYFQNTKKWNVWWIWFLCKRNYSNCLMSCISAITQIAQFMGPTWGQPGSCQPQMGPMLALWILLSG